MSHAVDRQSGPETVVIHIDKTKYESPSPTTGQALYQLGHVLSGYDLFLEIPGPGDDTLVPNGSEQFHLKNGMHFYTAKQSLNPGHE